jgi:hypothetical protein
VSLASDTARVASNQTMALTLYWFIGQCEESAAKGRQGMSLATILEMINEKLAAFERVRTLACNDERARKEREADAFHAAEAQRRIEADAAWRLNNQLGNSLAVKPSDDGTLVFTAKEAA